ncbi:MAG: hypothetical protein ACTSWW_08400 [Promethearchaeota archaeon]
MNLFKKRSKLSKSTRVIHTHPIYDDPCHSLTEIKILDGNQMHVHLHASIDNPNGCLDID